MTIATATRREFTITCVRRDDAGNWTARVTIAGQRTVNVDRSQGSWRVTPRSSGDTWSHVTPFYARELQARVRPLERRERVAA